MQKELVITNQDLLIMNLVHYFVTDKNYNPVVLHGIEDEIWLENMNGDYKIIRIVGRYIHNNEQLGYDKFKLQQILRKLKFKTLSLKMNALTIYTDLGDNVTLKNEDSKYYYDVFVQNLSDLETSSYLLELFPNIIEKTNYEEEGIELFAKISEDMNKKNYEKSRSMHKLFSEKKPYITYGIIAICIIVFLMMYIFGEGSTHIYTLLKYGAILDVLIENGQYYRLITSIFVHIGISHLLCNMYSLYVIGAQIENFFGKIKYLLIFLISGLSGSLLALAFSPNTIIAGASGAIFGLLGAMAYFGYYYRVYLGTVLKSQIIPIIGLNLLLSFFVSSISLSGHIGGLIGGILTAMAIGVPEKENKREKINGKILLLIYLLFLIYLSFFY